MILTMVPQDGARIGQVTQFTNRGYRVDYMILMRSRINTAPGPLKRSQSEVSRLGTKEWAFNRLLSYRFCFLSMRGR